MIIDCVCALQIYGLTIAAGSGHTVALELLIKSKTEPTTANKYAATLSTSSRSNCCLELRHFAPQLKSCIMAAPMSLRNVEAAAREQLEKNAYTYFAMGAEDEDTLKENELAWRRWKLKPR